MEKLLISHNRHWIKKYSDLYPRDLFNKLIKKMDLKHIQILQGIRRSGKSTMFKILINYLMKSTDAKEILFINFDDPFFIKYGNEPEKLYEIVETARKLTGKTIKYFFLDEVQAIVGWEHYVKVVYDNNEFKKIFITGSNSSLLNSQFATLLTGRYLFDMVYPLSFSEILKIKGLKSSSLKLIEEKPKVLGIVDDMLKHGSYVEVFESDEEFKREIIATYYDAIILKDCVTNNKIRDIKTFKELSYYLISNVASLYSYNSLSKAIGIHDKSVKEYVQYLQSAYLLFELKQFSYSIKEQQNNRKKPYVIDNGFINLSFKFSSNKGTLLENLVFSELHKSNKSLFFYNKGFECDFIIQNDDNTLEAIQVCYELNEQNEKREISSLKKIEKVLQITKKTVITYNQEKYIDEIKVVPFWKYFS